MTRFDPVGKISPKHRRHQTIVGAIGALELELINEQRNMMQTRVIIQDLCCQSAHDLELSGPLLRCGHGNLDCDITLMTVCYLV